MYLNKLLRNHSAPFSSYLSLLVLTGFTLSPASASPAAPAIQRFNCFPEQGASDGGLYVGGGSRLEIEVRYQSPYSARAATHARLTYFTFSRDGKEKTIHREIELAEESVGTFIQPGFEHRLFLEHFDNMGMHDVAVVLSGSGDDERIRICRPVKSMK